MVFHPFTIIRLRLGRCKRQKNLTTVVPWTRSWKECGISMFLILTIRVCRALLLLNTSLCVALLREDQEHGSSVTPFSVKVPESEKVPKDELISESSCIQRITKWVYPLELSGTLGNCIADKASYVGMRTVVNKVDSVIVLRKETDWRLDTLQSSSFPKRMTKLYFVSRCTRSQISSRSYIHAAPLLVEDRALYVMLHYIWIPTFSKEKESHV